MTILRCDWHLKVPILTVVFTFWTRGSQECHKLESIDGGKLMLLSNLLFLNVQSTCISRLTALSFTLILKKSFNMPCFIFFMGCVITSTYEFIHFVCLLIQ